jgi:hypothetical protein
LLEPGIADGRADGIHIGIAMTDDDGLHGKLRMDGKQRGECDAGIAPRQGRDWSGIKRARR